MSAAEHVFVMLLLCLDAFNSERDHYSLLGVSRFASSKEIKKAFHKLALKHHPDKNQSPSSQQTFSHVVQAYEVLSDRLKRRVYDQMNHRAKDYPEDVDSNLFVGARGFQSKTDLQHLSLVELLHSLEIDEDFFMGDQTGFEEWSFNFGPEDEDETVEFSDLFNML